MKSLLTAVIPLYSLEDGVEKEINQLNRRVDAIELRLDYLKHIAIDRLAALLKITPLPCILTIRSASQGGQFSKTDDERLTLLQQCMQLQPDYLDVENDVSKDFITQLHQLSPSTKLICSTHYFKCTPDDLDSVLDAMQHPCVSIYKIVTYANTSLDALRMMAWVQSNSSHYRITGHCMGERGIISRITGPIIGNYFIYAAQHDRSAVVNHQISIEELHSTYFIRTINTQTQLFALIGDPVNRSIGHRFHNNYFHKRAINALYIKIKLTKKELPSFFDYCRKLPFRGMSVTMPLKKAVLPFIHNLSGIDAVNTLRINEENVTAINTDGIGALDAIEAQITVSGKHILVIGAGGAASAIIDEAHKRGASISIANRTAEHAIQLAHRYKATLIDFNHAVTQPFDIIINTIPDNAYQQPHLQQWLNTILQQKPTIMDINYHQDRSFFSECSIQWQCRQISGKQMFNNQALAQLAYWFDE